jgi:hypothetical protein
MLRCLHPYWEIALSHFKDLTMKRRTDMVRRQRKSGRSPMKTRMRVRRRMTMKSRMSLRV